jgi:hypothetical protein
MLCSFAARRFIPTLLPISYPDLLLALLETLLEIVSWFDGGYYTGYLPIVK